MFCSLGGVPELAWRKQDLSSVAKNKTKYQTKRYLLDSFSVLGFSELAWRKQDLSSFAQNKNTKTKSRFICVEFCLGS